MPEKDTNTSVPPGTILPESLNEISKESHEGHRHISGRLEDITTLHHRNRSIHWAAFVFSIISFILPFFWIFSSSPQPPLFWMWVDVALTVFFALEFFTRSGFRWNPGSYLRTRFFDFIALVPVLVLLYFQVPLVLVWAWIIVIARFGRCVDRILGDGFWTRNLFSLLEGFEEEITDRVMLRIVTRIRADLERGSFGKGIGEALERNKPGLLQKLRLHHPSGGVVGGLASLTGFNSALEQAEERTFSAVIEIIKSPEVDQAIRESISSAFITLEKELEVKSWRQNMGVKPEKSNDVKTSSQNQDKSTA